MSWDDLHDHMHEDLYRYEPDGLTDMVDAQIEDYLMYENGPAVSKMPDFDSLYEEIKLTGRDETYNISPEMEMDAVRNYVDPTNYEFENNYEIPPLTDEHWSNTTTNLKENLADEIETHNGLPQPFFQKNDDRIDFELRGNGIGKKFNKFYGWK
jgi:hypothetical protein